MLQHWVGVNHTPESRRDGAFSRTPEEQTLDFARLRRFVVEAESEWTARARELKRSVARPGPSSAQVSVQKTDANLGRRAFHHGSIFAFVSSRVLGGWACTCHLSLIDPKISDRVIFPLLPLDQLTPKQGTGLFCGNSIPMQYSPEPR